MQDDENAGAGEQDNDEFDAAFAERAVVSENANEAAQGPGEVGTDDDADDEREFSESFDSAADPVPAAVKVQDDDVAAKLAEKEAEIEKLRQSERSQKGRVAALNQKLAEQRAAAKPPEVAQGKETGANDNDDWEEFLREFPEMAAIVDKRLSKFDSQFESVAEKVERVSSTTETLVDNEIEAYKEKQFDRLRGKHTDLDEIKASSEFATWRQNAPDEIKEKIKSPHADDASVVLDSFKEQTGWGKQKPVPGKSEVERINERRAAALKNSAGISSKKVGHSPRQETDSGDDFDAAFAAGASKKEKERFNRY